MHVQGKCIDTKNTVRYAMCLCQIQYPCGPQNTDKGRSSDLASAYLAPSQENSVV